MEKFKVGVEIERSQTSAIVVQVEAQDLKQAEKLALEYVRQACYGDEIKNISKNLDFFNCWGDDEYSCLGIWGESNLELYNIDLDLVKKMKE
jgi:hypothetical protein